MANPGPSSATGRMEAARRHRARAYAARNELIAVLARMWESHLMPTGGSLTNLVGTKAEKLRDKRSVICIHSPAGLLCWVITQEEADEHFAGVEPIDVNHWDRSTAADRSARLAQLAVKWPKAPMFTEDPPPVEKKAAPKSKKKSAAKEKPAALPPRRPGEFHRKRHK